MATLRLWWGIQMRIGVLWIAPTQLRLIAKATETVRQITRRHKE